MHLNDLGWDNFFAQNFENLKAEGCFPLRITRENREKYIGINEFGEFTCEVSGKFRFNSNEKAKFPAVGDWVSATPLQNERKAVIHSLLPRKSYFSRKVAGEKTVEQVVAANIDILFIVTGLDHNYNLSRIERFLSLTWESGAVPVILLNKVDLCDEPEIKKNEVESIAIGVDVITITALKKDELVFLTRYIQPGKTVAFIGSSGAGKSTIINSLLGENRQAVQEISELGSRGRHTTSARELLVLPGGGMVIDTPGMRELQVWGDESGLKYTFADIETLASKCRFRDCSHNNEPDCEIQKSLTDGILSQSRFDNYLKLKKEFEYNSLRVEMNANAVEKKQWKKISEQIKNLKKEFK